jgi:hypothetical protein
MSDIDPILLGHNPFFGVDHLSKDRGAEREARFGDTSRIMDMVRFAVDNGVHGMMMSTHARANLIAEAVRNDARLLETMNFYPNLPYIAKYVKEANQKGVANVIFDQLKGTGFAEKVALFAKGGLGYQRKDVSGMMRTLIRVEMAPLRELKLKAVFLHNILTDLALGLGLKSIFELYIDEMSTHFKTRAAFATMNLPLLVQRFKEWGIERPLVMANVNKVGFAMNPSREACERCLAENDVEVMAMGSLASGYLKPDDAYEYIGRLPRVVSVVVGVSTPEHAAETFSAIRKHMSFD